MQPARQVGTNHLDVEDDEATAGHKHALSLFNCAHVIRDDVHCEGTYCLVERRVREWQLGRVRLARLDVLPSVRRDSLAGDVEHGWRHVYAHEVALLADEFAQVREVQACATGDVQHAVTTLDAQRETRFPAIEQTPAVRCVVIRRPIGERLANLFGGKHVLYLRPTVWPLTELA